MIAAAMAGAKGGVIAYTANMAVLGKKMLNKHGARLSFALQLFAALCAPNIVLLNLYVQNHYRGIRLLHTFGFGLIVALFSTAVFLALWKFTRLRGKALIIGVLFWAAFWFFHQMYALFNSQLVAQWAFAALLLLAIVFACFKFQKYTVPTYVLNTIAGTLCCLAFYNAFSAISVRLGKNMRPENVPYEIKTSFTVDTALPHPNVYFVQTDAMVGFDTINRYFGDSQGTLKSELNNRGFVINDTAKLYAGGTFIGVPMLTSPTFFDSYAKNIISGTKKLTNNSDKKIDVNTQFFEKFQEDGVAILDYQYGSVLNNNELAQSFIDAGYSQAANGVLDFGGSAVIEKFYNGLINATENGDDTEILTAPPVGDVFRQRFVDLLINTSALTLCGTTLANAISHRNSDAYLPQSIDYLPQYEDIVNRYIEPIVDDDRARQVVRILYDMLQTTKEPRLLYLVEGIAHYYFYFDENGHQREGANGLGVGEMYLQWQWAAKVMLACVDMILEQDPDAVIVLESDHGFHGYEYDEMRKDGYTEEDMRNLHYSVMSAVRIPPQYGTLSEPLDPLDITRYMVNNCVGENYEYLYYEKDD
jgi:hypothetical protein